MQFEEEKATLTFILLFFVCFTLKEALIVWYFSRHPAYFRASMLTFFLWILGILKLSSVTISRRNEAFTQILQIRLSCSSDVTLWHTVSCALSQMYKHLMTNPFRYFNAHMKIYWGEKESICGFPLEPACGRRIEQIGFFFFFLINISVLCVLAGRLHVALVLNGQLLSLRLNTEGSQTLRALADPGDKGRRGVGEWDQVLHLPLFLLPHTAIGLLPLLL